MKFGILFIAAILPVSVTSFEKTVCEQQLQTVSCPLGQLIMVDWVLYGRTDSTTCNVQGIRYSNVNCRSTAKTNIYVKNTCEGRSACLLNADNNVIGEDPCPGTPKYLKVQYRCTTTLTTPKTTQPTTPLTTPTTPSTTTATSRKTTTSLPTSTASTGVTTVTSPPVANLNQSGATTGSQVCHEFLVSGARGVPDSQLSSSSELSLGNNARRGRLYLLPETYPNGFHAAGGWTAKANDQKPWIQVKFNWPTIVQGLVTQGRHVAKFSGCCNEWATKYKVHYSTDGITWSAIMDQNTEKVFIGNTDNDTPVTHMLNCPITARFLRIYIIDYVKMPSIRFDVIGCPTNSEDIGTCPKGWKERPGSSTCYYISDQSDSKSWENAQITCQRNQGNLVKVDSLAERAWLQTELSALMTSQKLTTWWLGLNNRPRYDNKDYKWTDGTQLNPRILNWGPMSPNNAGQREHCAAYMLQSNQMDDRDCDAPLPYICEKKKYWNTPINTPSLQTALPTTLSTVAPSTAVHKVPIPIGGGIIKIGNHVFTTGCLNQTDCSSKPVGDYQSCLGCGYYITCAPGAVYVRPCPMGLKYDDNLQVCEQVSSTCQGP